MNECDVKLVAGHLCELPYQEDNTCYKTAANPLRLNQPDAETAVRLRGPPHFRRDWTGNDESDREQVTTNMKSEGQLNVAKSPTITFKSTPIKEGASASDVTVTGNLTIRGVTKAVIFPARVRMDGQDFGGEGRVKIKQTDFGYEPYSALLGAIKNQNEVIFNIKVVAHP